LKYLNPEAGLIHPYNIRALFERITIDIAETFPESKRVS
jgi:hypothetical protein